MKKSLLLSVFCAVMMDAVDIGSDREVVNYTSQQILNDGDRVATRAALQAGFTMRGILSTAIFDSLFPVLGDVALQGSTLTLNNDLIIQGAGSLVSLGNIFGNGLALDVRSNVSTIPEIALSSVECDLLFILENQENAHINSLDWTDDDQYIVMGIDANATAIVKVYKFNGTTVVLQDSKLLNGKNAYVVRWHPTADFIAVGTITDATAELYILKFDRAMGILTQTDSKLVGGSVTALGWHQAAGAYLAIGTDTSAQAVKIYSFDTGTGLLSVSPLDTINLSATGQTVQRGALDWDSFGSTYVAFGTTASGSNPTLYVYKFNTGPHTFSFNASIYPGRSVTALAWNPLTDHIIGVGLFGLNGSLVQVYQHDGGGGTVTLQTSASNHHDSVYALDWSRLTGDCIGVGCQDGLAGHVQTFFYQGSSPLALISVQHFSDPVRALRWSHNGHYVVIGNDSREMHLFESAENFFNNTFLTFDSLRLFFSSDVTINKALIRITGESSITGRGNSLTLGPTCSLTIAPNASLALKDITIKGVNDSKIACLDNTSTLTLQNATLFLDQNFGFTMGKLEILDNSVLRGTNFVFTYSSSYPLKIKSKSSLTLDDGLTFKYAPTSGASNLIQFTDATAQIILNGGTINTFENLVLTKGAITITRTSYLQDGSSSGISFGDEIVADDCRVMIDGGQQLEVTGGIINYKNINSASWRMASSNSLFNIQSGTRLNIFQNLNLASGIISFGSNTILGRKPGKTIIGSTHMLGNLSIATI